MTKHSSTPHVIILLAALLLVGCARVPLPAHVRFVAPFEEGIHGCEGAVNPFVAGGNVDLVSGVGRRGQVLRFQGRKPGVPAAIIVPGTNLPVAAGTVGAWFRWKNMANDEKRTTWLLALVPHTAEPFGGKGERQGTALCVLQQPDNSLVLAVYRMGKNGRDMFFSTGLDIAEPDRIAARIPLSEKGAPQWHHVRFGWNRAAKKAWLGVDDQLVSASVAFEGAAPHCLLVGTPPKLKTLNAAGFVGDLDDLIIDARDPGTAPEAGREPPKNLPPMARKIVKPVPATLLAGSPVGAPLESMIRTHLRMVMATQQHGGWAYSVAWPSEQCFLSTKVVMPYSSCYFASSKDQISAYAAGLLLAAYEGLGDEQYLESARKTAQAYIGLQHPDGWWPYNATYDPSKGRLVPVGSGGRVPLEDHAQAYPTMLMLLMHRLTGDKQYLRAGEKGANFILKAQNPNGSWSHHYNLKHQCGQNARSEYLRGGEINDDTTADQMQVMLLTYRRTGDPRYLASFLKAADWLVSAFVDQGAKGWAQQYDEHNAPVQARHFEPAAVSLSEGMRSPASKLVLAWRLTGDARYLEPVRKWVAWMWANRTYLDEERTKWGWYAYYDSKTGKPIAMSRRKVRFIDSPKGAREMGYTRFLKSIEDRMAGKYADHAARLKTRQARAATLANSEKAAVAGGKPYRFPLERLFSWESGSWLFWSQDTPAGQVVVPQTIRVALAIDDLFTMRLAKGQVSLEHPYASFTPSDWGSLFSRVVPPLELAKPLSAEERRSASKSSR
ncbi:MAG: hypothetical protein KAI66_03235 [Lentisphaeria bacterium]|nr:hypothetical protein [Lentisphaeria bacterium]